MPEAAALREIFEITNPLDTNEPEPPYTVKSSPNRSRRTGSIDMIVIHCIPPGQVVSASLPKPIEAVAIGDSVTGSDGRLHPVTETMSRCYEGYLIQVEARGVLPLLATPEHPVLVYRPYRTPGGYSYRPNSGEVEKQPCVRDWHARQPLWVDAKDVQLGDFLLSPIQDFSGEPESLQFPEESHHHNTVAIPQLEPSADVAWLFGFYLADGASLNGRTLQFTLSPHDDYERLCRTLRLLGVQPSVTEHDTYRRVVAHSVTLARSFKHWFGGGDIEKRIPSFLFKGWDLSALLDGLCAGDGYYDISRASWTISNTSRTLIQQSWQILVSLGKYPYLRVRSERSNGFSNAKPLYEVEFREAQWHYTAYWNGYYCLPVTRVSQHSYRGPVYNLEVESVHTYLVNGVITHNCTAGTNTAGAVATLCDPGREASAHIVIPDPAKPGEPDKTVRLVPDEFASWHARSSLTIGGRTGINTRSLGIELVNSAMAEDPYHPWQVEECARWCRYWMEKFPIRWIVTHAYLDPSRRRDPCVTFPWSDFLQKVLHKTVSPIDAGSLVVTVDGKRVDADAEVRDGSTWVELRSVIEAMGATVQKLGNEIKITR